MSDLRRRIAENLARFERRTLEIEGRRQAAVAIVLAPTEDGLSYALTRRALHMRRGAGNYALPGGNFEPGEDAVTAALRETSEELGIQLLPDAVLGLLDDFLTLGGHVVTPVVVWSHVSLTLAPNPDEVHEAWFARVEDLNHPEAPRMEPHPEGGPDILRMFAGRDWLNPPTAAWLYQFREVALHGRTARIDQVGMPAWTA